MYYIPYTLYAVAHVIFKATLFVGIFMTPPTHTHMCMREHTHTHTHFIEEEND